MSKNFELLTNVEGDRGLFQAAERKVEPSVSTSVTPPLGDVAREEVAKLVQRIFLTSREGGTPRAVAFCGIGHGDGATWICAQVALAVAAQGATSVCAVDANLRFARAPQLSRHSQSLRTCRSGPPSGTDSQVPGTWAQRQPVGAPGGRKC